MSITINLYYTGQNGSARRFAEEIISTGVVDLIRAEEGNLRSRKVLNLERLFLISQESKAHNFKEHRILIYKENRQY